MNKAISVTALGASTVLVLVGCGPSSHHAGTAASKAAASASALATNSAVVADKAKAKADVQACVVQIGVVKMAAHPVKEWPTLKTCLQGKAANQAAFNTCMDGLVTSVGVGTGKLTGWEVGVANCLVAGASPSPSVSP